MSSNIREVLKEEAKRHPEAVICIVRAFAIALIIMFLTPNSCSVVNNDHDKYDYVVIWADDVETFKNVYRLMRGFIPTWDFREPENSTEGVYSPFPTPQSGSTPPPEAGK